MAGVPVGLHRAGEPGGNNAPNANWGNRGGGGPASGNARRGQPQRRNIRLPAEAPSSNGFSFRRVSSLQCESDQVYTLNNDSPEAEFFTTGGMHTLETAARHSKSLPSCHGVVAAFDSAQLIVHSLKFSQLRQVIHPPASMEVEATGYYTPVTHESKSYITNPSGKLYEVRDVKGLDWTIELVFTADLGSFNQNSKGVVSNRKITYAVRMKPHKLPKDVTYIDAYPQSRVAGIEYGELMGSEFYAWGKVKMFVKEADILSHAKWPSDHEEAESVVSMSVQSGSGQSLRKYTFDSIDHCLHVHQPPRTKGEEGKWIRLCNFNIEQVLAIYEYWRREEGLPKFRLRVKCVLDSEQETSIHITPEDAYTTDTLDLRSIGVITAEVLIPMNSVDDRDMSSHFAKVCSLLQCEGYFKVEHLKAVINQLEWPKRISKIITYFGRQEDTDLFVFGNVAYQRGSLLTHEEACVTVLPSTFNSKENPGVPMLSNEFPKILVVPQEWVRYYFFVNFWNETLKAQFLNNVMQAKATFALSVMMLQCSKFWDGQAVIDMVPVGWLKSTAPNTGKTEALLMINSFAGWRHKGPYIGASSTAAALSNCLYKQADNVLCLDEIATKDSTNDEQSAKIKQSVHMIANHSSRVVYGKAEKPKTSFVGTSNILVNERDDAFLQRLILVIYKPLDTSGVDQSRSATYSQDWRATKELLSCLQPDFEELLMTLSDGEPKLDCEALADCTQFMNLAISTKYARNANMWGFLAYYMILLTAIAQGESRDYDDIFEYVCKYAVEQNYMATKHSNLLNRFLLDLEKCRSEVAMNPLTTEEKSIHWHNYRTLERPEGPHARMMNYVSIRLESVVNVIHKVCGVYYKVEEMRRAFEDSDFCTAGRARFYDIGKNPFPIDKTVMDDSTLVQQKVPLPEEELLESTLSRQRCIFIKKGHYDKIISEVYDKSRDLLDYKSLVLTSNNVSFGEYNFYESVTRRTSKAWFGLRAIGSTNFGKMCGIQNELLNARYSDKQLITGLQQRNIDNGFGTFAETYAPANLLTFFCYNKVPDQDALPPLVRINPFIYRNNQSDYLLPDDDPSIHYHKFLYEIDDDSRSSSRSTPKRRRDSPLRSGGAPSQQDSPSGSSTALSPRNAVNNTALGNSKKHHTRRIPEDDDPPEPVTQEIERASNEYVRHPICLLQVSDGINEDDEAAEEEENMRLQSAWVTCSRCGSEYPHSEVCSECN